MLVNACACALGRCQPALMHKVSAHRGEQTSLYNDPPIHKTGVVQRRRERELRACDGAHRPTCSA
eukprot:1961920-Pleurochrysis_carterae.AAC.1